MRNLVLLALLVCACTARAEVNEIRMARQYGIAFLPFIVMEQRKLIEKRAKEQALGDVKVTWGQGAGSSGMTGALLSDNLSFGAGVVPSLILLWARTKGSPLWRLCRRPPKLPSTWKKRHFSCHARFRRASSPTAGRSCGSRARPQRAMARARRRRSEGSGGFSAGAGRSARIMRP